MLILILWLAFAVLVGTAANARGRSGLGWLVLAVLLSPLVAGVILALLPDLRTRAMLEDIRKAGQSATTRLERAESP